MCLTTTKRRIWHCDYLVQRLLEETVLRGLGTELGQEAGRFRILDIGCGHGAWKTSLSRYSDEYVGVDVRAGPNVSIVAHAESLPVADCSFDSVICIMVLEHVRDYRKAIAEMHRVLKPKGLLVLATHGTWAIHGEPRDFWRWTPYGLQESLSAFAACRTEQVGSPLANLVMIWNLYIQRWQEEHASFRWILSPVIAVANLIGLLFSRSVSQATLAAVYVAFARK